YPSGRSRERLRIRSSKSRARSKREWRGGRLVRARLFARVARGQRARGARGLSATWAEWRRERLARAAARSAFETHPIGAPNPLDAPARSGQSREPARLVRQAAGSDAESAESNMV